MTAGLMEVVSAGFYDVEIDNNEPAIHVSGRSDTLHLGPAHGDDRLISSAIFGTF